MSAPRTNPAPTEQPEFLRKLQARLIDASFAAQQGADAIAALRQEPPVLKTDSERDAEIERIAALLGHDSNGSEFTQALAAIRRLYAPPVLPAEVEG